MNSEPMHELQIKLIGTPEARVSGSPIGPLRSRTGMWLLCLLALREGREVDRTWLAGTLWPDSLQEVAMGNLRRTLTDLRNALGEAARFLENPSPTRLRLSGGYCDVTHFRSLASGKCVGDWMEAAELGRGTLLEGCDEEWAAEERNAHEAGWLSVTERLADTLAAQARHREAADWYGALLARDPYRETALRNQMECLASCGCYSSALDSFRVMRDRLWESMRIAPAAETVQLYQQIRQSARSAPVTSSRSPQALPPVPGDAVPTANLVSDHSRSRPPTPLTGLIGRADELNELLTLVRGHRSVTLFGSGGVGKTRLAQEAARILEDEFEYGAIWVELAKIADGSRIAQLVAEAIGIRVELDRSIMETLKRHLHSRRTLVVLDNCEHVIDDATDFVRDLLRGTELPHILCTSRQFLEIPGEQVMRLSPFRVQESLESVAIQALATPAVQLFVERAISRDPAFQLTGDNLLPVLQICQRLDGIPLAIELAAARVSLLPVDQILARLDDRFRLLAGGLQTSTPHHRTLRGLVSWSYDLLHPEMATLFQRLSIFPGGCTLQTVAETCGDGEQDELDLMESLQGLVQRALIQHVDLEGGRRYVLLETLRAFSREKLEASGELPLMEERLLSWAGRFALRAKEMLESLTTPNALYIIGWEIENVRAALNGFGDPGLRLQIAASLLRYWEHLGNYMEGRMHIDRALPEAEAMGVDGRVIANATRVLGNLARLSGDFAEAKRVLLRAVDASIACGDVKLQAMANNTLGVLLMDSGETVAARDRYLAAQERFEQIGDLEGLSATIKNLGIISLRLGDMDEAERAQRRGLELCVKRDDWRGVCNAYLNLGTILQNKRDFEASRTATETGIELARKYNFVRDLRMLLTNLAELCTSLEQYDEARQHAREAIEIARSVNYPLGVADAVSVLASIEVRQGRLGDAGLFLLEVTEILLVHDDLLRSCTLLEDGAMWAAESKRWREAAVFLASAEEVRIQCGSPRLPADDLMLAGVRERTASALTHENLVDAQALGRKKTLRESLELLQSIIRT